MPETYGIYQTDSGRILLKYVKLCCVPIIPSTISVNVTPFLLGYDIFLIDVHQAGICL